MALLLALGLAACGRDGALEAPPAASVPAAAADPAAVSPLPHRAKSEPIVRPHEPFILDPLL